MWPSQSTLVAVFGVGATGYAMVALLVLAAVIGYRALQAWYTRYVLTDLRVMRVHGVFNRHSEFIPWGKVTDISRTETFFQWLTHSATIRIESANERSALRAIDDVDDPAHFYEMLVQMVERKQGRILTSAFRSARGLTRPGRSWP